LMRLQHGIAIAGTHGKTTTTSLVASVLAAGGLDPTYVIGGKLNKSGSNAYLGKSAYFVAEADESDASFLFLQPVVAIVTNVDADHMETYQGDFGKLCQTFLDFIHRLPFYGMAVLCQDDPILARLFSSVSRPYVTYGFSPQAHYRASDYMTQGTQSHFIVTRPAPFGKLEITLNMPGQHNVLNSLSAIAVATEHGVSDAAIQSGLAQFSGVNRRLTQRGQFHLPVGEILLLDDYGHHPREISVTIAAVRAAWPGRRIVHVFQPHRFSRTASLWGDFVSVLSQSDFLWLMDIYPANETPLPGITSERMLSDIQALGGDARLAPKSSSFMSNLHSHLQNGDIVLLQGAGDIGSLCNQVADYLESQSRALA
jgi:UDP-N-acetylmuramate--alanine ligase